MAALQTGVFENGRWVTRRVNIHEILQENERREARERQPEPRQQQQLHHQPEPPVLGLLSRTILRSPVINWIIPARVRHREKNDVVFIGEDFIHIKEILSDGHLRHVASKADFGSHIRAARVFGEPRKFIHPPMIEQPQSPMEIDYTEVIPPQILVLTLESQELIFLFAHQNPDGTIDFWSSAVPLDANRSFLEQPGKHLAVDPRSRAVAVAASESTIFIYTAKTMNNLRDNFSASTDNWTPIKAELPVVVPGIILKMEFLYPEPGDKHHVILLVIYTRDRKTRMTCYEWDHQQGLKFVRRVVEGFPLHKNQQLPLLLIPLQHGPSFMLVGEKEIYLHQEIMTGNPTRSAVALASDEGPRYPGNSRRLPVWTSWARTGRNWIWNGKPEENFYLVREDGVVHYMQVNSRSGALTSKAGHFQCNVNTAFASLDVGFYLDTPDVLVAAGDMSPGEIVKIGQWRDEISFNERISSPKTRAQVMEPDFISAIPNWGPTMDMALAEPSNGRSSIAGSRSKVLTTAGRAPYGAVTELRVGIEAKLGFTFASSELSGVTGLWTLSDASHDGVFFLLSFPSSTILLRLFQDASDPQVDFDEDSSGIDFSNETLLSEPIDEEMAIQITSRTIVVLDTTSSAQALPRKGFWELPSEQTVIAATSCPELSAVYLAVRTEEGLTIQPAVIADRDGEAKFSWLPTTQLHDDPTCLQVLEFHMGHVLLVASTDGLIRLYAIGQDGGLGLLIASHQIDQSSTQTSLAACQSAVLLSSTQFDPSKSNDMTLVCGLRNGDLYSIEVHCANNANGIKLENGASTEPTAAKSLSWTIAFGGSTRTKFGQTPATVIKDGGEESTVAFATCGPEFCRLDYSKGRETGLEINNVWFTDRNQPALQQGPVSAVCRIPRQPHLTRDLGNALVCIAGNAFLVAQLAQKKQAVPRHLPIKGTPHRVVYSQFLKASFVATTENFPASGYRVAHCYVKMVEDGCEDTCTAGYALAPGSRVNSMMEWVLTGENGKKHAMIAVGTTESDGRSGRLTILQRRVETDAVYLTAAKEIDFKSTVYSLASYGDASLVVCFGTKVRIYRYQSQSPRFRLSCEHELPSPGVQITTCEPIIHITTAQDSLMAFKLNSTGAADNSEAETLRFETFFTDRQARQASCHLPLTLPHSATSHNPASNGTHDTTNPTAPSTPSTLVLVADKSASITGLLQPATRTYQTAAPTIFEAALPRSVTRLRRPARSTMKPPYRQAAVPGILVNDIVGSASDGTLFGFSILHERVWRLLRFLQGLCRAEDRRVMEARPGSGRGPGVAQVLLQHQQLQFRKARDASTDMDAMDVDGEDDVRSSGGGGGGKSTTSLMREADPDRDAPGLRRKTAYHVDGDALARFLEGRGGHARLRRLVGEVEGPEGAEVRRRFCELVARAFGDENASATTTTGRAGVGVALGGPVGGGPETESVRLERDVARVLAWLRDVLEPAV
ncbi:uncharacterized protein K452DRAFT_302199 [Aplosporella prunicola CBS 121167]|uniref:Cleavage/polyadenylation specificity factor A subunit N-terminal domain-containing protein n=1 Tax=Aplosporella prunicola CBS 121167 TaxID=1176127 RepID=A0A6A6AZW3_9PEZI|nr:uncharacterized protein K452DRAFT_302199 [Aplosporella prunicola CBS 121167]KAF2137166.1 hypothetical protein K452DRAFT_302199 [Aplosporella prunicola CBS 121167]